jgi:uncharacterized membrane protein
MQEEPFKGIESNELKVFMGRQWSDYSKPLSTGFRALTIFVLALGIALRFVNLDQKIYWLDETFTSLHVSGYSDAEVVRRIRGGQIIRNRDFLRYQIPNAEKKVGDTVQRISMTAPELPPIYFVLARIWQQGLGSSVAVIRSFSAVLSLFAFPCIYWLCWELWRSPLTGWTAVMLVATSPLHLETAQEARPYTLLVVIILACHAALLRARRMQTATSWGLYAGIVGMGLYTHLLFGLVLLAHGLYIGFTEHWRWRPQFRAYAVASCLGIGTFIPWIVFALSHVSHRPEDFTPKYLSGLNLVVYWIKGWVRGLSLIFVDFNLNEHSALAQLIPFLIVLLLLLLLIAYAAWAVWRSESKSTRLFLGLAIVIPALAVVLANVLTDSIQSVTARYWWPTYLGIQLLMARFFVTHAIAVPSKVLLRKLWRTAFGSLLCIGILSCIAFSQSQFWWNKTDDRQIYRSAQLINAAQQPLAQQPLVISDAFFIDFFPLSHQLNPDVALQLWTKSDIPQFDSQNKASQNQTVFLYRPSTVLLKAAEKRHPFKIARDLWRCTSN